MTVIIFIRILCANVALSCHLSARKTAKASFKNPLNLKIIFILGEKSVSETSRRREPTVYFFDKPQSSNLGALILI